MSPDAATSRNSGESTNSRPYWSRLLTASSQESSIFWNWWISGDDVVVIGNWTGGLVGAGTCATEEQERRRTTEKQAAKRFISVPILPNTMISLGLRRGLGGSR